MTSPYPERIAGLEFAKWKEVPHPIRRPWVAPLGLAIVCAWMLGGFGWSLSLLEAGRIAFASRVVLLALIFPILAGYALAVVIRLKRLPVKAIPTEVPPDALPIRVSTYADSRVLGDSDGWLWFERGWLHFRGERFDLRLQRLDFDASRPLKEDFLVRNAHRIKAGSKMPSIVLSLNPGGGLRSYMRMRAAQARMSDAIAEWEASRPLGVSLLPPIRYPAEKLSMPSSKGERALSAVIVGGSLFALSAFVLRASSNSASLTAGLLPTLIPVAIFFCAEPSECRRRQLWDRRIDELGHPGGETR